MNTLQALIVGSLYVVIFTTSTVSSNREELQMSIDGIHHEMCEMHIWYKRLSRLGMDGNYHSPAGDEICSWVGRKI